MTTQLSATQFQDTVVKTFSTMALAIADENLEEDDVLLIKDRANSHWDVVLSSGVTENGYNVVQGVGVGTLSFVLRQKPDTIDPRQWGAALDGVTNDTLVLRAIADYINAAGGGYTVDFGDTTSVLISYQGSAYASVFGYVVMDFLNAPNTHIKGRNVTIRCVSHNITTYGGFRFINFAGCPNHSVEGFYFDMTFTGYNTSASFYPFCGAITAYETATGSHTQAEINSNVSYRDLRFKLYHEKGCYMRSANPYAGDNNNGFKIYSVFCYGDYLATAYANQHRNCEFTKITFEDGHNGYGLWAWAYNNVRYDGVNGMSFVSKYSDSAGNFGGGGVPMLRYHQWHCSGLFIDNIYFRAKPCSERTTTGFEGEGRLMNLDPGLSGNYSHGITTIGENIICILGKGDSANSITDVGIYIDLFGVINVGAVIFDSCTETTNAYTEEHFRYDAAATLGDGFGLLHIGEFTFGKNCDYSQNIVIDNAASSASARRLKRLTIDSVVSYGQLQYTLYILESGTAYGVPEVIVGNMTIDGSDNSVFNSASSDSRSMRLACSEATDKITFGHLSIRNKYRVAITDNVNCSVGNFVINDLKVTGITDYWTTDVPVVHMTGLNTPESVVVANIGSTFHRCNGGAATCFYVKESGTAGTGWVAK